MRRLHTTVIMKSNHYAVLGLDPFATPKDIKAAYIVRARETHPDVDGGDPLTFDKVVTAHEILRNKETRAAYDAELGKAPGNTFKLATETPYQRRLRILIERGDVDVAVEKWGLGDAGLKTLLLIIETCHKNLKIPSDLHALLGHLHATEPEHMKGRPGDTEASAVAMFCERKTKAYNDLIRLCDAAGTRENVFEVIDAMEANKIQLDMDTLQALEEIFTLGTKRPLSPKEMEGGNKPKNAESRAT